MLIRVDLAWRDGKDVSVGAGVVKFFLPGLKVVVNSNFKTPILLPLSCWETVSRSDGASRIRN